MSHRRRVRPCSLRHPQRIGSGHPANIARIGAAVIGVVDPARPFAGDPEGCMPPEQRQPDHSGVWPAPDWDSCSSTCGLPVAGSIGCFNPTMTPGKMPPPPHLLNADGGRHRPVSARCPPGFAGAPARGRMGGQQCRRDSDNENPSCKPMNHSPKIRGLHSNKSDLCNAGLRPAAVQIAPARESG